MECKIDGEKCGFQCTGADFSHVWKELHTTVLQKIDCEACHDHAKELFSFIHDVVNLGLGKPAFDEKNFRKIFKQVKCVSKTLGEHGVE